MNTYGIEKLGIINPKAVYRNLGTAELVEKALERKEGKLSNKGALVVNTGKYTGRSPDDKFVVDYPSIHDEIAWGKVNVPMAPETFDKIYDKMVAKGWYTNQQAEQTKITQARQKFSGG